MFMAMMMGFFEKFTDLRNFEVALKIKIFHLQFYRLDHKQSFEFSKFSVRSMNWLRVLKRYVCFFIFQYSTILRNRK